MNKVFIQDCTYSNIQDKVDSIFDRFPTRWSGKKVVVKPNILGPYRPEKAVTTHPSLVRAVVRRLSSLGAKVIVGDNPGVRSYGCIERAVRISEIIDAAKGCYRNIGKNSVKVKINTLETFVSKDILDCDIYISLPKFKTHMSTVITGGIKNNFGIVVGQEKTKLHRLFPKHKDFAALIVDVYCIRPPDLLIMDAVVGMEGDGPNSPHLREINKLIAADNAVAMDTIMCYMMGLSTQDVPLMQIAKERKLGATSLDQIDVDGKLVRLDNFRLPITFVKSRNFYGLRDAFLFHLAGKGKLFIDPKKCTGCLFCIQACPQNAIKAAKCVNDGKPALDTSDCTLCFCCKEVCQNNAVILRGVFALLQRIFNRG
jgi:uncharacterized protein (DUF362 family)/Pyruvate/2-oxoacid:ferredoxin oxidoreductase delta subunit